MVLGPWGRWARRKVARFGVFFKRTTRDIFVGFGSSKKDVEDLNYL